MSGVGRRIRPDVIYDNVNVTTEIEDFIETLSFRDNLSGESDSLSLTLSDREGRWNNQWRPKKGSVLKASLLVSTGWDDPKAKSRFLGVFEIDELGISGPPMTSNVRGLSVPESSSLRKSGKSRAWEKSSLKAVAGAIAKANGMSLYFSADENPSYDRIDQEGQTDLAFLMKLCGDAGLSLKVANKKIIILDEERLEKGTSVMTISRKDKAMKSYSGKDALTTMYRSCSVKYTDPKKKKTYRYVFTPSKAPATSRVLYINEEVKSSAAAATLARKKLREANKDAMTFSVVLAGFLNVFAGQVVTLKEFGSFDGRYLVTSMSASVSKGTDTSLELRKCLEGY